MIGNTGGKFNIVTTLGECEECLVDQHPDTLARNCITATCPAFYILKSSGYCEECKERLYMPDSMGRSCEETSCASGYERLNEGAECEDCGAGEYPDTKKGRTCEGQNCDYYEYLSNDGACEDCMGNNKFGVRYAGCFTDVEMEDLPAYKLTPWECYEQAKTEGAQYIVL